MESIVQWVKNLIFIILFTSLLAMFLPENSMRKYVRVVMGFFIITILISPITAIFDKDFQSIYQIQPEKMIEDNWDDIKQRGEELEQNNQTLLKEYYQKKVTNRVNEVINLNYNNYERQIQITLDDNYQLRNISVTLFNKQIKEVKIDNIKIGEGESQNKTSSNINQISGGLTEQLSQVFQIPVSQINVSVKQGR